MRHAALAFSLATFVLFGCSGKPVMRPEPVDIKGTVKLPLGVSPKDLTVTFQPQQNSQPGGGKVAADGTFSVQLTPGKYSVYFQDEVNAKVPAYKSVPEKFRTPSDENTVTVESGQSLTIDVK